MSFSRYDQIVNAITNDIDIIEKDLAAIDRTKLNDNNLRYIQEQCQTPIRKIAVDLKAVASEEFAKITPEEIKANGVSKNTTALAEINEAIKRKIFADIYSEENIDKRTLALERWIAVLQQSIEIGDYNSAITINAALRHIFADKAEPIKKTIEGLSENAKKNNG